MYNHQLLYQGDPEYCSPVRRVTKNNTYKNLSLAPHEGCTSTITSSYMVHTLLKVNICFLSITFISLAMENKQNETFFYSHCNQRRHIRHMAAILASSQLARAAYDPQQDLVYLTDTQTDTPSYLPPVINDRLTLLDGWFSVPPLPPACTLLSHHYHL